MTPIRNAIGGVWHAARRASPKHTLCTNTSALEPPPPPWRDWDEVRRVREDLRLHRTLFLHQTENLTAEELQTLAGLLGGPVGSELSIAGTFIEAWFAIWKDDLGRRRTPDEAEQRYFIWQADAQVTTLAPLRRQ